MKTKLKRLFLSILFGLASLTQTQQVPPVPNGQMGMPSVNDIFGSMSQDDIVQQVQEAEKFFNSLSEDERKEVEKMVEETLKTMSDQDLQDIQNIATMVEPHLDIPKQDIKEDAALDTAVQDAKDTKDPIDIDTDNIQQLIKSINKQVDEVLQKAQSSKELTEELMHKWQSKLTFDNMHRQIHGLKEERLAKKLSKKDSKEDQDLVEALQGFHTDISKHNKAFKVEDTFGLPDSRKEEQKQLGHLQEMLSMFDIHIDKIMPLTEKFLRKYDPETLELAKEAEARAKKAKDHAKDAEVKRGSPPAQGLPEGGRRGGVTPTMPTGTANFPQQDINFPEANESQQGYPNQAKSLDPLGGAQPSDKSKSDNAAKQTTLSPYQEVANALEDHVGMFDNKHETEFSNFLQKEIKKYPNPKEAENIPANPEERDQWLNTEFGSYMNITQEKASKLSREFSQINDSIDDHLKSIAKINTEKELQKLLEDKNFKTLKSRAAKYRELYTPAKETINKKFLDNVSIESDPLKGAATLSEYKQKHQTFMQYLQEHLDVPLSKTEDALDTLEHRIKLQKRRLKTKSK